MYEGYWLPQYIHQHLLLETKVLIEEILTIWRADQYAIIGQFLYLTKRTNEVPANTQPGDLHFQSSSTKYRLKRNPFLLFAHMLGTL